MGYETYRSSREPSIWSWQFVKDIGSLIAAAIDVLVWGGVGAICTFIAGMTIGLPVAFVIALVLPDLMTALPPDWMDWFIRGLFAIGALIGIGYGAERRVDEAMRKRDLSLR